MAKKVTSIINSLGLKAYKTYANFILVEVREQNNKKKNYI